MFGLLSEIGGANAAPREARTAERTTTRPNPELVTVTPSLAQRWLETVPDYQRKIKARKIDAYARDMAAGNWRLTHQGIAFDEDGRLADGQNRMHAIVKSGVPVAMYVFRGLSREAIQQVDTGKARTVADALKVGGASVSSAEHVSVAMVLLYAHTSRRSFTASEVGAFLRAHGEAIEFGASIFAGRSKKRGVTSAPVLAAIAVAYESDPSTEDALRRFATVLYDGITEDRDSDLAAIKLRDTLQLYGTKRNGNDGSGSRVDVYRRTQRAIRAFLDRRPLAKLYAPRDFIFVPKGIDA